MSLQLLKSSLLTLVSLTFVFFAYPLRGQEAIRYSVWVAGVQVTSENCSDLTVIEGVSGKVSFDSDTKTLTLDNASIHSTGDGEYAHGIYNEYWKEYHPEGLTIRLIGDNSIVAEGKAGIFSKRDLKNKTNAKLTIVGDGKLKITSKENPGIYNKAYLTIRDCTIETDNPLWGISDGFWAFENCNVRIRGAKWGSLLDFYEMPVFKGCSITSPAGATWSKDNSGKYSLCGADGEPIKDWIEIMRTKDNAVEVVVDSETEEVSAIYSIDGVRLSDELNNLPTGVYIIGGKKVFHAR